MINEIKSEAYEMLGEKMEIAGFNFDNEFEKIITKIPVNDKTNALRQVVKALGELLYLSLPPAKTKVGKIIRWVLKNISGLGSIHKA